jgi:hypothetical protein
MSLDAIEAILNGSDTESTNGRLNIVRDIGMYAVGLFVELDSGQGVEVRFAGSGTLVSVDKSHYILTARHVWEKVLQPAPRLGITLRISVDHRFYMDTKTIVPFGPPKPSHWSESGPDIVFLRIPDVHVGTIKASKVFYNLSINEPTPPNAAHIEAWFLMGAPGCLGTYFKKHASIELRGIEVVVQKAFESQGFDYFDAMVKVSDLPSPKTLGGVSGGGLWKVLLFDSPSGRGIESVVMLRGVAFWEFPLKNDNRVVRYHGVESIRSVARDIEVAK